MESSGTFLCQRFDCPRETDRDCSLCEKPRLTKDVAAVLALYQRCRQFNALPGAGGIMDQEERIMDLLGFVESEVEHWRAERAQDREGETMKQKMLHEGVPGGR